MKTDRCILVAEDDENDVFFLQRAFEQAGVNHPLHIVRDGEDAIDYLAGQGKFSSRTEYPFPTLLILDLKMPRKTGLDVLQWLRGQEGLQCLPVIILSSSSHRNDIEKAYRHGANAFVVKPSSNATRAELARMIKGFWLTFNEPPLVSTEGREAARQAHAAFKLPSPFF